MTTRPRRYGPFDPHAPNNEDLTHPPTLTMVALTLQGSTMNPNNPPRPSGLSEGFPRTYSGPRAVTTTPNLGETPAHSPDTHMDHGCGLGRMINSMMFAGLWACCSRAIDSLHQGLSNALLDVAIGRHLAHFVTNAHLPGGGDRAVTSSVFVRHTRRTLRRTQYR